MYQGVFIRAGSSLYYAKKSGALCRKEWEKIKDASGKKQYYYFGKDCRAAMGLQKVGKKTYYFFETGNTPGARAVSTTVTASDGKTYTLGADGVLKSRS